MTYNQQILGVVLLIALGLAGALTISHYRANTIGTASQVTSAVNEAISFEHRGIVTIVLTTTNNNSTLTITDAAGNATPYPLYAPITINGAASLTATMQPDGTTTIPGVTTTSVPLVTPNANFTLNLSPLSLTS